MSLILDALSRSQRERGGDVDVPGIDTQHYHTPIPEQRRWRTAIPWIALGLALLVIFFLLSREEGASPPAEHNRSTVTAEQTPAVASEPAPAQRTIPEALADTSGQSQGVVSEPPRAEPAERVPSQHRDSPATSSSANVSPALAPPANDAVAALYHTPTKVSDRAAGTASTPASTLAARAASRPSSDSVDRSSARTQVGEPDTQKSDAVASRETTEPVDIEALLARAEQEVAQSRLSEHPAPFLDQLSQQKKDQIPTLMYSRHDYSSQASQSSVLINGKTVKVGATVAPGVKLDEILPDSSVFSYRGEPFRLVALNSWVNL